MERREGAKGIETAGGKLRKTRLWHLALASLDDPLRDQTARSLDIDASRARTRATGLAEAKRQKEVVLGRQADAVLFVMVLMGEPHEGWALEFDDIGTIRMSDILDQ